MTYNVMEVAASAMRGCIIALKGKKLVVADLSNIEGRVQAWLAGEQWKLQAFRDFDTVRGQDGKWYTGPEFYELVLAGRAPLLERNAKGEPIRKGHDLYKLSYAKSFGIKPEDVNSDQRQKGKVQELALGYQGGVGAFVTFALNYNIDLEQMAADAWDTLPPDLVDEAESFLSWLHAKVWDASEKRIKKGADRQEEANRVKKELDAAQYGLSREVFIVCDVFKRAWRLAHPKIASIWKELGDAVIMATNCPGQTYTVGVLKIRRDGAWLRIRLPSGGFLCYPSPRVGTGRRVKELDGEEEDEETAVKGQWSYMGLNQYSHKWTRIKSYGGKIFENICQAVARDVMAYNMPDVEAAGYEIILTVHDELLTEALDNYRFRPDYLAALLAASKDWSKGLPLAAAGFEDHSYHK